MNTVSIVSNRIIGSSLIVFALTLAILLPAQAGSSAADTELALKGYDAVAYFTQQKAVKGSKAFSYQWNGQEWHFSSADNLRIFKSAPHKFAPQYEGFCAYAVAKGKKAPGDPEAWAVVDGRLFLNLNKSIQQTWLADRDDFIVQSDRNWPSVSRK